MQPKRRCKWTPAVSLTSRSSSAPQKSMPRCWPPATATLWIFGLKLFRARRSFVIGAVGRAFSISHPILRPARPSLGCQGKAGGSPPGRIVEIDPSLYAAHKDNQAFRHACFGFWSSCSGFLTRPGPNQGSALGRTCRASSGSSVCSPSTFMCSARKHSSRLR
jgi:hypothetical protein